MAKNYESVLVHFAGEYLFWLTDDRKSGTLAPPEHMTSIDELDIVAGLLKHSYAHVENGVVWRYGHVIGNISEFEFI